MTPDDELERRLTAFIEGQLAPCEAAAVTELITSDPAAARAYAELKLTSDRAAHAASCCDRGEVDHGATENPGILRRICRMFGA